MKYRFLNLSLGSFFLTIYVRPVPILVGVAFGFDEVRVGKFDIRFDPALTLLTGSPNP